MILDCCQVHGQEINTVFPVMISRKEAVGALGKAIKVKNEVNFGRNSSFTKSPRLLLMLFKRPRGQLIFTSHFPEWSHCCNLSLYIS